ncbi:MAG: cytochrome C [Nitrospirae bacterium]|nr:cytochrome C [Nitrospirota bacterium]
MHNSVDGMQINPLAPAYLLRQQDPSSTCLSCHEHAGDPGPTTYHVSTPVNELLPGIPPKQLTPAGDFGWLNKTFSWVSNPTSATAYSYGERHGHNIVAADYMYDADSTNTTAPGGTYPANSLGCISCHDPHGKYRRNLDGSITTTGRPIADSGSFASSRDPDSGMSVGVYRMLGGQNYRPKSLIGGLAFVNDPPAAVAPDQPNRSEAATQTRVAYGAGMSEWCINCHPNMQGGGMTGHHIAGSTAKLGAVKADNYAKYVKTGDLSGSWATSYLSLVPFEEGTTDYSTLKAHAKTDDSVLVGPNGTTSQVMCLTCHRAHASGWDHMTKWNTGTDYIVYNGYYSQEGQAYQPYGQGRTEAEATRPYYDKPAGKFALNQDALCNKCHNGNYRGM